MKTIIAILVLFCSQLIMAQQMVYKPINPAFGGDTFNYQWLLSSASAQNQFDNKDPYNLSDFTNLDSFGDSLNRQLLSQLTQKLFSEQFGDGPLKPGTYMFGDLFIEITQSSQGLLLNILDTRNGDQSQIIIP